MFRDLEGVLPACKADFVTLKIASDPLTENFPIVLAKRRDL